MNLSRDMVGMSVLVCSSCVLKCPIHEIIKLEAFQLLLKYAYLFPLINK